MLRDILTDLISWQEAGESAALATVIQTWGSSPRPAGSHMAVRADGVFAGSVSGGCVETAVIEAALEVIHSGTAQQLNFGVADETAWEVGLACGGKIEVFVSGIDWEALNPILEKLQQDLPAWYQINLDDAGQISAAEKGENPVPTPYLDESLTPPRLILFAPPPRQLLIVGGVNIAQDLVGFAQQMGYRVIIADPRKAFASEIRFPNADRILSEWPEEAFAKSNITSSTAIAVLTHDDKIDLPALQMAVNSPAFYVGALGSKTTFARRIDALSQSGVPPEKIQRIHSPIGVDIHAKTPKEIALSIMAEIIAASNAKT
jgi:xanthine dehydrogenase accessory factor